MLSVVIPMYNAENHIRHTLSSILDGVSAVSEVIVVDDNSRDSSKQLVSSVISTDSRVVLLETPQNGGPGPARNIGLAHVTSPYVMFVDSDDEVIGKTVDFATKQLMTFDIDTVICPYILQSSRKYRVAKNMNAIDVRIFNEIFKFGDVRIIGNRDKLSLLNLTNYPWNKLHKTSFAKKNIKFPSHRQHEDILPHWKGILESEHILLLNMPLVEYFMNPFTGNLSNDKSELRFHLIDALADLQDYIIGRRKSLSVYQSYIEFTADVLMWAANMISPEYRSGFAHRAADFLASQPMDLFDAVLRQNHAIACRFADTLEMAQ